jgi:hypothetical protein
MAVYKLFPEKDATIYSGYPSMNTGLDSIIESSTDFKIGNPTQIDDSSTPQVSRYLVQFSQTEIENLFSDTISGSYESYLKVFNANAQGLNNTTEIKINAISQDWNMGTGKYLTDPESNNGCSWKFRLLSGSGTWTTDGSVTGTTGSFNISTNSNSEGGGSWYTGSEASQSFNYYTDLDVNVEVTDIVTNWSSSDFTNYGFIVRQSSSQEFVNNIDNQTSLKYFSRDTNTIYPPQLEFRWNDVSFSTGSSSTTVTDTNELLITLANNKIKYYPEEIAKFKFNVTKKYPTRTFQTSSAYTQNFYLPTSSLYAIKDDKTNEYVIDFDSNYTRISSDENNSYFDLYMNGLEPERYYTILVKTNIDGETKIFDKELSFKVING